MSVNTGIKPTTVEVTIIYMRWQIYSMIYGDITGMHRLPWNDGRWSGDSCQHRGIHLVANDTKSAGPVRAFNGGRLPFITAVFISSLLITGKTSTSNMICTEIKCGCEHHKTCRALKVNCAQNKADALLTTVHYIIVVWVKNVLNNVLSNTSNFSKCIQLLLPVSNGFCPDSSSHNTTPKL